MKPLKSHIKKDAEKMINKSIEEIFFTLHTKYNTRGGDITPMQQTILDNFKEELPRLIAEQVFQNIKFEEITTKELDKLNRSELIELAYSLDWNGSWDDDEEGQLPITETELKEAILSMCNDYK